MPRLSSNLYNTDNKYKHRMVVYIFSQNVFCLYTFFPLSAETFDKLVSSEWPSLHFHSRIIRKNRLKMTISGKTIFLEFQKMAGKVRFLEIG